MELFSVFGSSLALLKLLIRRSHVEFFFQIVSELLIPGCACTCGGAKLALWRIYLVEGVKKPMLLPFDKKNSANNLLFNSEHICYLKQVAQVPVGGSKLLAKMVSLKVLTPGFSTDCLTTVVSFKQKSLPFRKRHNSCWVTEIFLKIS